MPDPINSSRHLKALKSAARKVQTSSGAHAFYFMRGPKGYLLHIDPKPNMKHDRFRTPKLIDQHLKLSRYEKDGVLKDGGTLSDYRSCSGTVDFSDGKLVFDVQSRAGKAGPADLKKGLSAVFKQTILGAEGVLKTGNSSTSDSSPNLAQTAATLLRTLSGRRAALSGDIEQLGAQMSDLRDYLDSGAVISNNDRKRYEKLYAKLERHYETVQDWNPQLGHFKDFAENLVDLESSIESEAIEDARELIGEFDGLLDELEDLDVSQLSEQKAAELTAAAEQKARDKFRELTRDISNSSLPSNKFQELLASVKDKIGDTEPFKSAIDVFSKTEQSADKIGQNFEFVQELLTDSDDLAQQAIKKLEGKMGKLKVGQRLASKKDFETWGAHIKVLSEAFKGGKQAALYAGNMGRIAGQYSVETDKWSAIAGAEGDVEGTLAMYGSYKKEGDSLLEGIVYLTNAGFMADGKIELNGEAQAHLGPLSGKINGMLKLYGSVAGEMTAEAALSVSDGIKLSFEGKFEALVSAEASVWTTITVRGVGKAEAKAFVKAVAGGEGEAKGTFVLSPKGTMVAEGQLKAKFGATVEASGSASIQSEEGDTLFKTAGKIGVTTGFAFELGGRFAVEAGTIKFRVNIGAAVGLGGNLALDVEVDVKKVATMVLDAIVDTIKTLKGLHPKAYLILNGDSNSRALKIRDDIEDIAELRKRITPGVQSFGPVQAKLVYKELLKGDLPKIKQWWKDEDSQEKEYKELITEKLLKAHKEIEEDISTLREPSDQKPLHGVFEGYTPKGAADWAAFLVQAVIEVTFHVDDIELTVSSDRKNPITVNSITLKP